MEFNERDFKLGMITALSAVKKTLEIYPDGMSPKDINDLLDELDQQLGIKQTEMHLYRRA